MQLTDTLGQGGGTGLKTPDRAFVDEGTFVLPAGVRVEAGP